MTRGRLPSGSWVEVGSRYRTRDGDVVTIAKIIDTGLRIQTRDGWIPGLIVRGELEGEGPGATLWFHGWGAHSCANGCTNRRACGLDLIRRAFK